MESGKRVVESYWRSRMIDGATTDDDKLAPVYKLDEICDLLRSSNGGIVREVSELLSKRLEHRSPLVKQKALRLIKYAVGKSGPDFRREMQARVTTIRPLVSYKGQMDLVKGDAVNKAVRDTAQEAISAIFSQPENKSSSDLNRRIRGFGNTNYESPLEDKKSFLSGVVGIGSTSIKRGLGSFSQGKLFIRNGSSSGLQSSLTLEDGDMGRYKAVEECTDAQRSSIACSNVSSGSWNPKVGMVYREWGSGVSALSNMESKSQEELLLETVVNPVGVRLQPTRDAIQAFLLEAAKAEPAALCRAIETKLQSPQWQVRMRAVCVLDAIVRRKDDNCFSVIASYFREGSSAIISCLESPQASLKEKAGKVFSLLNGQQRLDGLAGKSVKSGKDETDTGAAILDRVAAKDSREIHGMHTPVEVFDAKTDDLPNLAGISIDDLLGCNSSPDDKAIDGGGYIDPFADVSFHVSQVQEPADGLSGGSTVGGKEYPVNDAPASALAASDKQKEHFPEALLTASKSVPDYHVSMDALNNQPSLNGFVPASGYPYVMPNGMVANSTLASLPIDYAAIGNFLAQQQYLAALSNFHHQGSLNNQSIGGLHSNGGYCSSAIPGIIPQAPGLVRNGLKEETKAFDFISDHLAAAAHESKRVA
ncbi:hypothetical protein MLD38_030719 [Melastoma candidum]|uniref:Uncharacterized protein n=1 Tax=Melastoma candidum TaxID=119954 RepID=A0ACB9MP23_9MYRT|nr:hypothetical protein MLD38_030719 [Melastoma candidum]